MATLNLIACHRRNKYLSTPVLLVLFLRKLAIISIITVELAFVIGGISASGNHDRNQQPHPFVRRDTLVETRKRVRIVPRRTSAPTQRDKKGKVHCENQLESRCLNGFYYDFMGRRGGGGSNMNIPSNDSSSTIYDTDTPVATNSDASSAFSNEEDQSTQTAAETFERGQQHSSTKATRKRLMFLGFLIARFKRGDRLTLWLIPVIGAIVSYQSYPQLATLFHNLVLRISNNTWIPENTEHLNLQTNVITQVVNGPVITSISVLFATLVSVTVQHLHSRQVEIKGSFIREIEILRQLERLVESKIASHVLNTSELSMARACVQLHADELLLQEVTNTYKYRLNAKSSAFQDPYRYIESDLLILKDCIHDVHMSALPRKRGASTAVIESQQQYLLAQMENFTNQIMEQRTVRWLAMKALNFPSVHYATLTWLALSIGVSFLVATDEAEYIFLKGLQVRILWTLLTTSFAALAVLCYDLSRPFGGAYRVSE